MEVKVLKKLVFKIIVAATFIFILTFKNAYGYSQNELVDLFAQIFDALYIGVKNEPQESKDEYLILDLQSMETSDLTYDHREEILNYFKNKYNKIAINSSLYLLKEQGFADKYGNILINGPLLTITYMNTNEKGQLIVEGVKHYGPLKGKFYRITVEKVNGSWKVINVELTGIS